MWHFTDIEDMWSVNQPVSSLLPGLFSAKTFKHIYEYIWIKGKLIYTVQSHVIVMLWCHRHVVPDRWNTDNII